MSKSLPDRPAQEGVISDEAIRERAYDIWERHHRPEGFEMQFWLMAKRELMAEREAGNLSSKALDKVEDR
jgi:hypothetical protein